MPFVRSDIEVVVRFNGRRLRVNKDWHEVNEDAAKRLSEEAGVEVSAEDPSVVKVEAPSPSPQSSDAVPPKPEPGSDGGGGGKGKQTPSAPKRR